MSSLAWGASGHFSSALGFRPALLYMMLNTAFDVRIVKATHVPGEENILCDSLSRGRSPGELGVPSDLVLDLQEGTVGEMMRLCDPTNSIESEDDFLQLWEGARHLLRELQKK